jgi:hypothetical protein
MGLASFGDSLVKLMDGGATNADVFGFLLWYKGCLILAMVLAVDNRLVFEIL